jgi:hypothetical protein
MAKGLQILNHPLSFQGRFPRVGRLRDEYYDQIESPEAFLGALNREAPACCDIFTFAQPVADPVPRYSYPREADSVAVLELSSYEHWWKKQVNDKTRNMVRKAAKAGVELRETTFDDEFVAGIVRIYNESPLRQGRRFRHYGKPFDVIKQEHSTFLDRSELIGAYYEGELIGFIKLVHGQGVSNLMQIISMISHRDKAPTNALLAKAVERCTTLGIPRLHYGVWSRRSMGDFKKHHAFTRVEIPRYYIPLTTVGSLALRLGLHRSVMDRIPEPWLDKMADWRTKWNYYRYAEKTAKPVSAAPAVQPASR